jgi:hypothetical protein
MMIPLVLKPPIAENANKAKKTSGEDPIAGECAVMGAERVSVSVVAKDEMKEEEDIGGEILRVDGGEAVAREASLGEMRVARQGANECPGSDDVWEVRVLIGVTDRAKRHVLEILNKAISEKTAVNATLRGCIGVKEVAGL